jgi:hypothetical protein
MRSKTIRPLVSPHHYRKGTSLTVISDAYQLPLTFSHPPATSITNKHNQLNLPGNSIL